MLKVKPYEVLIIIAASILIVLPFANQAFSIDDDIYLNAAIKYNDLGFDSLRGESEQEGVMYPNYYITHPLLWPWFLALFMKLFSTHNEIVLHLISIINLIIIGISSISISRRFSSKPLLVSLFLLFLPAVMLLSHVMMTDVPTLAFFLLALSLHMEGIERNSILILILSGIAASIAGGISYQALFILFLFFFYNYLKKEKKLVSYISILIPVLFFIVWCIYTWIEFGIAHPFIAFQWANIAGRDLLHNFFPKFISNINAIGAAAILPLFILMIYSVKHKFRKFLLLSFLTSVIAVLIFAMNYSFMQKSLFVIYFTSGFFLLIRLILVFTDSLKTSDKKNIFLAVWFITFFAIIVVAMPLGVARYLLPCFLPLIIIVINDINDFFTSKQFKYVAATGLFLTVLWGTLVSIADYQFTDTYRDVSKKMGEKYKNQDVWFCSDGLKWYMEKEGFKPLLYDHIEVKRGDIIVISTELWPYEVSEVMGRAKLIDKIAYDSDYPVRTMNIASHAGFYDQTMALLPFSITRGGYEEFLIYKIVK